MTALIFVLLLVIRECVKIIDSSKTDDRSTNLTVNVILIAVLSIVLISLLITTKNKVYRLEPYRSVSLTEVSDLITVDKDKVEIKPLTDKQSNYDYTYEVDDDNVIQIDRNETQTFKIEEDTFYDRMYLIDRNNSKHELSKEEIDLIKSKRN